MNVYFKAALGILLPFFGTALGAAAVFFKKKKRDPRADEVLLGFASGVMAAASVWSLLLPAIELSEYLCALRFLPAVCGVLAGGGMLWGFDKLIPRLTITAERLKIGSLRTLLLVCAVTLHNLPEGIAVGVVFAGLLEGSAAITFSGAMALSLGVALQNLPEGAIVSLPIAAEGGGKPRAFFAGVLSGAVEPVGAVCALLISSLASSVLPYLLSFAAGAMIYVVVEELIPQAHEGEHGHRATVSTLCGFTLMMLLDVALQ